MAVDINQMKSELEFNTWLESIEFADGSGRVLPLLLAEDESDDPEGDRE